VEASVVTRGAATVICALATMAVTGAGFAEDGVRDNRIVFGQSAALSGPAAELGIEMRRGIMAAFAEANAAGGITGRRIELVSRDDRYEPEAAVASTTALIREDKVFALIGEVGTPTSAAAEPIARSAGVPFIAPFTGAEFLRDPKLRNVVNIRASYFEETETIVERLVADRGLRRIAVLYQDDSYGRSGLAGVDQALARRSMKPVAAGTYVRNTTAVKTALLGIRGGSPEAIIVIGAYLPSAVFTKWARKLGLDAVVVNISFVGANALAEALGPAGEGVYVTQVVPFPTGDGMPVLADYRRALAAFDPDAMPGFGSLEGYIAGRLTLDVLSRLGPSPTRAGFLAELASQGTFDIGGFRLRYGPRDNRGSDQVFLTVIRGNGDIEPVGSLAP
jgi:ABC-type branched-subunit amino acid transport system substrate-binding protein